nr:WD-40 repeat-containing protein MSI1 [Tanacetum cinerariifolium]
MFDCRNHLTKYPIGGTSNPDVRLIGHTSGGFGLSWSKVNEGLLLSGSNDSRICLWDTNLTPVNHKLDFLRRYQ